MAAHVVSVSSQLSRKVENRLMPAQSENDRNLSRRLEQREGPKPLSRSRASLDGLTYKYESQFDR